MCGGLVFSNKGPRFFITGAVGQPAHPPLKRGAARSYVSANGVNLRPRGTGKEGYAPIRFAGPACSQPYWRMPLFQRCPFRSTAQHMRASALIVKERKAAFRLARNYHQCEKNAHPRGGFVLSIRKNSRAPRI